MSSSEGEGDPLEREASVVEEDPEDHTYFEEQKLKWLAETFESGGRLFTNINALNRSIESANLVGTQFATVYDLWSKLSMPIINFSFPSTAITV
ncbi:hypothetical protein CROQUDRAFT_35195 [Cronartium quercuum f. sp. fusiforme G11]|uniref:DASH complex subunit DAD1 n=1 Tax=Cronartium quercuum f. sp. fusiforme G11 TaxID=708437 RepID=A0A9P6NRZ2_9BASI|nr:hypothetical protein CROQUDRAFT_35195 [Cronartium quercuum f. sp. fusiforme G11]